MAAKYGRTVNLVTGRGAGKRSYGGGPKVAGGRKPGKASTGLKGIKTVAPSRFAKAPPRGQGKPAPKPKTVRAYKRVPSASASPSLPQRKAGRQPFPGSGGANG